jgi:hypothetical protein
VFGGLATVTVYQFTAEIPDFTADAGTRYWLAAASVAQPPTNPSLAWIQGTGGDSLAAQIHFTNGVVGPTSLLPSPVADRALSMTEAVPEPATLGLLGMGFGALAARRRRRS